MRILLFGDNLGVPQLLRHIESIYIVGIVGAAIRPQYLEALQELARCLQVPFIVQPKINSSLYQQFKDDVQKISPDLIWVNSYSMIVRPDILAIPTFGGINIHGALLPQYRGCNPVQWAILNKETEVGVTMHEMSAVLDQGDIIDCLGVPLLHDDTWATAQAKILEATDVLIKKNLPSILNGKWQSYVQDESLAKHYPRRTPDDGAFTWKQPVHAIYDLHRSLVPPMPGAFYMTLSGEKIILSSFYSLIEIAALKYGEVGAQQIESEDIRLHLLNGKDRFEFLIEEVKVGANIGGAQLKNINWCSRDAELQIQINQSIPEMIDMEEKVVELIVKFGFGELNLQRIFLRELVPNQHTKKIYEKCGFQKEDLHRDANCIDGKWYDATLMSVSSDAYE